MGDRGASQEAQTPFLSYMENLLIIAKSLEQKRDLYQEKSLSGLVPHFLFLQINTFFSIYTLSIAETQEAPESTGNKNKVYRDYLSAKFTPLRYLFELYLTTAHILGSADPRKEALSLALSQQVQLQEINLQLYNSQERLDALTTVQQTRENYKKFIQAYAGDWAHILPEEIDELLPQNGRWDSFNLTYYKFSKVEYSKEILENPIVLQTVTEILTVDPTSRLRQMYAMLSLYNHPTLATMEELNTFISQNDSGKNRLIDKTKEFNATILGVIGRAMDNLAQVGINTISPN